MEDKEVKEEVKKEASIPYPEKEAKSKTQPFAIDYILDEDIYRTIVNAPSAEAALQELVRLAGGSAPILALRLDATEDGKERLHPALVRLCDYKHIEIEQIGVAKIQTPKA